MSKFKEAVLNANLPEKLISIEVDSTGVYAVSNDGNNVMIISSNKYRSPMSAFEKVCKYVDLKLGGKL